MSGLNFIQDVYEGGLDDKCIVHFIDGMRKTMIVLCTANSKFFADFYYLFMSVYFAGVLLVHYDSPQFCETARIPAEFNMPQSADARIAVKLPRTSEDDPPARASTTMPA
uniref:Innexin n=1 Tax=Panagrellus redivivus TaxID=6233 RepID=A0A7E4W5Y3_PANRE